jgi:hypothetical protein
MVHVLATCMVHGWIGACMLQAVRSPAPIFALISSTARAVCTGLRRSACETVQARHTSRLRRSVREHCCGQNALL